MMIKPFRLAIDRWRLLSVAIVGSSCLLLTTVVVRALKEQSFENSYAAVADAFLHGRLSVERCFDFDCAVYAGKIYVVFPPLPAVFATPFVALFGISFSGFIALAGLCAGVAAFIWFKIFRERGLASVDAGLLILILMFGTPIYYVVSRSNGVWLFAQTVAFLLVTTTIHEAMRQRLFSAGLCLGLAMLSRQLVVALAPFVFLLSYEPERPLIRVDAIVLRRAFAFGVPLAVASIAYLAYNSARFGEPFETGYRYIFSELHFPFPLGLSLAKYGLFSPKYFVHNAVYLLVQGFHIEFTGETLTNTAGLDWYGTSLLAASPFLILLVFVPMGREVIVGLFTVTAMIALMLFYFSNGTWQANVQRYTLDWLPVVFLWFPFVLTTKDRMNIFRILGMYAITLNIVTFVVLYRHGLF